MVVLAGVAGAAALDLRREHEQPHPPLRDRRLHGLHALAGRDGAVLVRAPRAALAAEGAVNARRRDGDRRRDADRRLHEVRRGRVARHGRDPAARPGDARHPAALRAARAPAHGRRRRGRRRASGAELDAAARRVARRGERTRRSGSRGRSRRRRLRAVHVPTPRHRSGHPPALVQAHAAGCRRSRRSTRSWRRDRRRARAGLAAAARRVATSSPSSCPERFDRESLARAGRGIRTSSRSSSACSPSRASSSRTCRSSRGRSVAEPAAAHRPRARLRRQRRVDAGGELRAARSTSTTSAPSTSPSAARTHASIASEWARHGPRIPLEVDEAPYRDIGPPLLGYLRELTADEGTQVLVLMPELVDARLAAAAPQPAGALREAAAALRAGRDPRCGSVPAPPLAARTRVRRVASRRRQARSSSAFSGRTRSSRPRTATSARRSTTRSA